MKKRKYIVRNNWIEQHHSFSFHSDEKDEEYNRRALEEENGKQRMLSSFSYSSTYQLSAW